jgi:hypothetical protein
MSTIEPASTFSVLSGLGLAYTEGSCFESFNSDMISSTTMQAGEGDGELFYHESGDVSDVYVPQQECWRSRMPMAI